MAMLDIEYRYSGKPLGNKDIRRKSIDEMNAYMMSLVVEMQLAKISVKYNTSVAIDEPNMVFINGRKVPDILKGLKIVIPEPDDDGCGCNGAKKPINIGRPEMEWDEKYIEDIPDVLMKNAIAKVYAEMNDNNIDVI